MFKDFFKKTVKTESPETSSTDHIAGAMKQAIAEKKKKDPLVGVKIGSKEVTQRLINGLKDQRGVHIESILTVLGALAGYACQMSVREQFVKRGTMSEEQAFVIAQGADGHKYYFGDLLNKPLAESKYSVWGLTAGSVQNFGKSPPDLDDIFKHVAQTVGENTFGIPRVPEKHAAGDLPINYLKVIWPTMLPVIHQYCDKPEEWPILFGLSIQEVIVMGKTVIDPSLAASIVMECAVPMSKVDWLA